MARPADPRKSAAWQRRLRALVQAARTGNVRDGAVSKRRGASAERCDATGDDPRRRAVGDGATTQAIPPQAHLNILSRLRKKHLRFAEGVRRDR
jgi:hypothetical protein